ncbi:HNH endonuclease [sulfur-oxidizing endosymbiont of Gigantopelta aegis]|uniref:HNH endonuclease n=1 Tax=sulfur-oxidizing endosymbiont of Gigantopelta aegis TaxID=2794934 RepID=UPI0018DAF765|nr:HNH endonuclease [sulfur-oxidizing endosymbiont of Gigantopelta aegis]
MTLGSLITKTESVELLNSIMPGGSNWHNARKTNTDCLNNCPWSKKCKGNGSGGFVCSDEWEKAEPTPLVLDVLFHVLNNWDFYNQEDLKGISKETESVKKLRNYVFELSHEMDIEYEEGGVSIRTHYYRERKSSAAIKLKKKALNEKKIVCKACEIYYYEKLSELGIKLIECHHLIPISSSEHTGKTKISELVLLCANCHRLIHSRKEPLSVEELQKILNYEMANK